MKFPILLPNIFDHPFTYESSIDLKLGDYVEVPFGKSKITGVVWDEFEKKSNKTFKIKKVLRKLDVTPLKKNKNIIISGDFNVIPEEIDCHDHKKYENDALFKIEIRKKFRELLNLGFTDVYRYINRNKQEFTFWDYTSGSWQKNNGLRIDHFLVSNNILKNVQNIFINKKPRSKIKPSDHTPIELDIN